MYYFDKTTLQQYLDLKRDLQVYVDRDWYSISDMSDLQDNIDGIGYDDNGQSHYFDYRDVEQIKSGNTVFTLDQLNAQFGNPQQEEKPEKTAPDEEDVSLDEPTDEKEKPEKEPDLSHYSPHDVGHRLMLELRRQRWK